MDKLVEATDELRAIEDEILDALRERRLNDYPGLSKRLRDARKRYDELVERHFQAST